MTNYTEDELLVRLRIALNEKFPTLNSALERMELDAEDRFSAVLTGLGITNLKKSERKSLPAQHQMSRTKNFNAYFGNILDIATLKRMVVRDLLERGQCKIRFYIDIQPDYNEEGVIESLTYNVIWYEHRCY